MTAAIRVLYVDDETDLLDIDKRYLERSGNFEVVTAINAPEAIRLLEQKQFDAIVSDYQMPGMNGIEFLIEVRKRFGSIPFILFTGRGREEVVIQAINSGANFYLQKGDEPYSLFAELSHKIKQATSQKKAEESLRESEEKFRTLLQNINDGVMVHEIHADGAGKIIEVNDRFCEITGYTRDELLQLSVRDLDTPELKTQIPETMRQLADKKHAIFENEYRTPDGRRVQIEISVRIFDLQGKPVGLSTVRNITERKRVEEALVESEERFRVLLQNIPLVAIQGYSIDGTTQHWDEASEHLYGYTAREAIGKNLIDLIIPPEMQEDVRKAIKYMAESGQPIPASELALMRKDGSRVTVFSSHAILKKAGGGMELFCIDIDLTERNKTEEDLRVLTQELETRILKRTEELEQEIIHRITAEKAIMSSLNEKEILLREIHHRVKNNLQIVTSLIRLQKQKITEPGTMDILQDSESRIRSMALIHEKLYNSNDLTAIDFSDYIRSLSSSLINAYNADQSRIRLVIDVKDLSLDINRAIPAGLIMNELISNSLKHACPGDRTGVITITGRCNTDCIFLSVQDNGVGLPKGMDWRNTSTLGLHLVITLIKQVGGSIELNRSEGTTFEMSIPSATRSSPE